MYAVFTEVNADESHTEAAREILPQVAAPGAREGEPKAGTGSHRRTVVGSRSSCSTRKRPRKAAEMFTVGEPPMPGAPAGVTVKTVEVREVLASVG